MAIITEDYVSFETAKLLKEKGFNEPCECAYSEGGQYLLSCYKGIANRRIKNEEALDFSYSSTAPTLQMAMKWLREVHNIAIVVAPSMFWGRYNVSIYKKGNDYPYGFDGGDLVPSYEQACEAAIKYSLKNLI